jgi:hypothetical protein
MKYTLASVLIFTVFCGIPAFVQQEGRTHILAETISTAWRRPKIEKRATEGAQARKSCVRYM